ncbi:hypothetical protein PISMIDRAFT_48578, partial [Pisolithus microcarpus 441]
MMQEFADRIVSNTGVSFDPKKRRLRCMAHIINLATQAFLAAHSKSKHFDPADPDTDLTAAVRDGVDCDEVGLVRAIVVKERSSAKHKELFRCLQMCTDDGRELQNPGVPLQLLLDMKVRWSSTFLMLRRALDLKKDVNRFVRHLSLQERDADKCRKIMELELTEVEWVRMQLLLSLLSYAEKAQHAFSSEQGLALHTALPALEALHKAWSTRKSSAKYRDFTSGLNAGLTKVSVYYERTATSDAHIMAM